MSDKIRFFAHLAEHVLNETGRDFLTRDELNLSPDASVDAVFKAIAGALPTLEKFLSSCRLATSSTFLKNNEHIPATGDLAVISPVSGG